MDIGVNVVAPAGKGSLRRRPRAKHDGRVGACMRRRIRVRKRRIRMRKGRGTGRGDWGLNPGVLKHHAGGMLSAYREAFRKP